MTPCFFGLLDKTLMEVPSQYDMLVERLTRVHSPTHPVDRHVVIATDFDSIIFIRL